MSPLSDSDSMPEHDAICLTPIAVAPDLMTVGFLGAVIRLSDGSQWKLTEALSNIKYQNTDPPYEAGQVFVATRLEDPPNNYDGIETAVMKVKYQTRGTCADIDEEKWVQYCEAEYTKKSVAKTLKSLQLAQEKLYNAKHPAKWLHRYNESEIAALTHFRHVKCANTPHLLNSAYTLLNTDASRIDEVAMPCGYAVFVLMAKVPGKPLVYEDDWSRSQEERHEIPTAFKITMLEVWDCRVVPKDRALRNILWDEAERKCYIVDFEDIDLTSAEDCAQWDDDEWTMWQLAEEWFREGLEDPNHYGAN